MRASSARRTSGPPLWLVLGAPCLLLLAGVSQFVGECELQPSPTPSHQSVAAPVTSQR